MQVTFTFRNVEAGDWLKDYVNKKLAKLERYIDKPMEIQVILAVEKFRNVAEIKLLAKGVNLTGKDEAKELTLAVDKVIDKIERQVKKHKEKVRSHKDAITREESVEPLASGDADSIEGGQPRLVEIRKVVLNPMSVDDAVMEIEESKSRFVIYRDISSENVSVIYRRDDGNYGMIEASN
ncbi:MAG: ribosome-associated translation inhibitor RaiA [Deltaproteobacteria bacterium]|nr:ribosome-associated translation inhibitor RaiA [Deltaproteobacteria bacterium]